MYNYVTIVECQVLKLPMIPNTLSLDKNVGCFEVKNSTQYASHTKIFFGVDVNVINSNNYLITNLFMSCHCF